MCVRADGTDVNLAAAFEAVGANRAKTLRELCTGGTTNAFNLLGPITKDGKLCTATELAAAECATSYSCSTSLWIIPAAAVS